LLSQEILLHSASQQNYDFGQKMMQKFQKKIT